MLRSAAHHGCARRWDGRVPGRGADVAAAPGLAAGTSRLLALKTGQQAGRLPCAGSSRAGESAPLAAGSGASSSTGSPRTAGRPAQRSAARVGDGFDVGCGAWEGPASGAGRRTSSVARASADSPLPMESPSARQMPTDEPPTAKPGGQPRGTLPSLSPQHPPQPAPLPRPPRLPPRPCAPAPTWPLSPMSRKQASGKMAAYSRNRLSFLAASCWYSAATAVLGSSGGASAGNHVTTPSHCSSALGPAAGQDGVTMRGWGGGGGGAGGL